MKKDIEKLKGKIDKVTRDIKVKDYLNLMNTDITKVIKPSQTTQRQQQNLSLFKQNDGSIISSIIRSVKIVER
jgi:hypothetical protein